MRNLLPNFEWLKHLAKNMDAKCSFASVLTIAIVFIDIFGGAGGSTLGYILALPLTIVSVSIAWGKRDKPQLHTTRRSGRRAKPKLLPNRQNSESIQSDKQHSLTQQH